MMFTDKDGDLNELGLIVFCIWGLMGVITPAIYGTFCLYEAYGFGAVVAAWAVISSALFVAAIHESQRKAKLNAVKAEFEKARR